MPIINRQDADEVEQEVVRFFAASSAGRAQALRRLFIEKLDFASATGTVSLASAPKTVALPPAAERIASIEGLHVVYVPLPTPANAGPDRVRKAEASAAAKLIADALHGDLLLVMTNPSGSQLHIIYPTFVGAAPSLRRMIIERDLPRRTAVQQLSNIFWLGKDTGSVRMAVDRAFDVDAVTKEFFAKYKSVFDAVMASVKGFDQGKEEEEAKKLFTQTMFNRLMFIYFLSRKGWLRFKGNPDYLNALRKDYPTWLGEKNFYNNRIKVLFFTGLNNPGSRDLTRGASPLIDDVPFLNGGLFEETDLDKQPNVLVPDAAIDQILHDLFDKFNFTVMESTPFDVEVAVDPEMLGKVFEELVTGRHESGSYYTPRPVVAFMCREALKGYLETQNTGASTEAISAFVDHKDTSTLTLPSAPKIGEALARVKVVDPACGSGAYLLGMMQELVELMTTLYSAQLSHEAQDLYNLKLRIIEQNLYGADIDRFAVNIAMLRLWLSLAIDYDGPVPPPLPNLNFKIVCGDSLLGPDPNPSSQTTLFRHRVHELAGQLATLKDRHMRATGQEKTNLTTEVEALKVQLREALAESAAPAGAVDWRVEFAEVFDQNGGFDVAIANPPYVRNEEIGPTKETLRELYPDATTGRSDLFCYFYARGVQLLQPGGLHVFVCSNAWLDAVYGTALIHWLTKRTTIEAIYDSEIERQFTTAGINTIVSVIRNGLPEDPGSSARFATFLAPFSEATTGLNLHDAMPDVPKIRVNQKRHADLSSEINVFVQLDASPKWGGRFLRAPQAYVHLYEALEKSGMTLENYVQGERYLNTGGADGFFILTEVEDIDSTTCRIQVTSKEGADFGYPKFVIEKQFLRSGLRSTDLDFLIAHPDCWVLSIPPDTPIHKFQVRDYIKWGESAGFDERSVTRTQRPWWKPPLQAQRGAKLLWGRTHADSHRIFLNPELLISVRFFRLHPKEDWLTEPIWALLNSTIYALLKEIHGRRGLGYGGLETGLVDILPLPVPKIGPSQAKGLGSAIRQIARRPIGPLVAEVERGDRRALDELILQAIGLPTGFVDEIYKSTLYMLAQRAAKAGTISKL
ncbi:MAG: Eco57I restriction-modification methylase domain-containing protein [Chloroflexi bacterium]|nr:Eco57I restriction-modification methylase domain-containing protein [Chloroflexota bacterium]